MSARAYDTLTPSLVGKTVRLTSPGLSVEGLLIDFEVESETSWTFGSRDPLVSGLKVTATIHIAGAGRVRAVVAADATLEALG